MQVSPKNQISRLPDQGQEMGLCRDRDALIPAYPRTLADVGSYIGLSDASAFTRVPATSIS